MTAWKLRILLSAATVVAIGCTDDDPWPPSVLDASFPSTAEAGVDPNCIDQTSGAWKTLECSGLYEDFATKRVKAGIREFAPSTALWSDGADKTRWIQLPPGTKIDNSNPAEWKFPIGTKAWKEFRANGKRMETRLWEKKSEGIAGWAGTTYQWLDNETRTQMSTGGEIPLEGGGTYVIPTPQECGMCHDGRRDRLLGFEAPLLGLPGAKGITLEMLAQEGLLTNPPAKTKYEMLDDGTGIAKQILPWLHVNCGVSCHNEWPNAKGYVTNLFMRIHPGELEGKPLAEWNIIAKTIDVVSQQAQFMGMPRIVSGSPEESLIYNLASLRGPVQMPPIATRVTDPVHTELLYKWIIARGELNKPPAAPDAGAMPPGMMPPAMMPPAPDAGGPVTSDAGVANDAQTPGAVADAGVPPPSAVEDAAVPSVEDAAVPAVEDAQAPGADTDAALPEQPDLDGAVVPVDLEASTPDPDATAPVEMPVVTPVEMPVTPV